MKDGMLHQDSGATRRPGERQPRAFDEGELGEHRVSPFARVGRRKAMREAQPVS